MPHQSVDPIYMGSQIVSALQSLVSRNTDPTDPAVVSVTQFHSGSAYNVIPESAQLCGTVRTFSHELRDEMETSMQRVCQSVAESLGGSAELSYVVRNCISHHSFNISESGTNAQTHNTGTKKDTQLRSMNRMPRKEFNMLRTQSLERKM